MLEEIKKQTHSAVCELLEKANLNKGDIFVLGASSSEIVGGSIGKQSNQEVGEVVVKEILEILNQKGIYLAVQGCEHINRALVIEREIAYKNNLEIVSVIPALHAGGSMSMAAYKFFKDPVMVEHLVAKAGMDIGDTFIGMHVKFVQVPVRLSLKEIGKAHLSALKSRPKLIGGKRAIYE